MVPVQDETFQEIDISGGSSEDESGSEESGDLKHKRLLKDLSSKLGHEKKREFSSSRKGASDEVSEYTWSSTDKVSLQDLVSVLDSSSNRSVTKVKRKLQKMQNKTKTLEKPLEKIHQERVERSVAYGETAKDISKWDETIQKNRKAEQLVFPLNDYKPPAMSIKNMAIDFKPQTEMEKQISDVLHKNQHLLERRDKELTEAEEKALQTVDLEDAMERRKELQRMRALQSYYEVKRHRTNKIKSKKYHKILRKEQEKAKSKIDLEVLAKEDPELFKSEMEKAEHLRAKERASLKHRNTSKWAKNLITKGHKNKEDRESIREQLRISRELTDHKTMPESDEDDVDNNVSAKAEESNIDFLLLKQHDDVSENPWLLDKQNTSLDSKCAKPQAITSTEKLSEDKSSDEDDTLPIDEWEEAGKDHELRSEEIVTEERKLPSVDESNKSLEHKADISSDAKLTKAKPGGGVSLVDGPANTLKLICQNAKVDKVESVAKKKKRKLKKNVKEVKPVTICEDQDSNDELTFDNTEQTMDINEAFANDDVLADFLQEKNEAIEMDKPKVIDTTLPGWGEWGGAGLSVSKKKKQKFTKEAGPAPKRKDLGNPNVIINEKINSSFTKHQVNMVPFPYSNKAEFERSIRQPIGGHWNTPAVHSKLIEPKVSTVPGVTINPMKATKRMKRKFAKEFAPK